MHAHARHFIGAGMLSVLLLPAIAEAHGYVGNRFFPATTATVDPFAVDELAFPTVSYVHDPGHVHNLNASLEFDKEIFPISPSAIRIEADLGGTGNKHIGESFTTVSPVLYFGKGFGPEGQEASDRLTAARAVTGHVSGAMAGVFGGRSPDARPV